MLLSQWGSKHKRTHTHTRPRKFAWHEPRLRRGYRGNKSPHVTNVQPLGIDDRSGPAYLNSILKVEHPNEVSTTSWETGQGGWGVLVARKHGGNHA